MTTIPTTPPPGGATAGTGELTVYRAEHRGIPLGTYANPAAARAHCEHQMRTKAPDGPRLALDWIGEDDFADGDPLELAARLDGEEWSTGYTVVPVTVPAAFDPEAEE